MSQLGQEWLGVRVAILGVGVCAKSWKKSIHEGGCLGGGSLHECERGGCPMSGGSVLEVPVLTGGR
eukprot:11875206-Prorocentrum_lima.AAC.1